MIFQIKLSAFCVTFAISAVMRVPESEAKRVEAPNTIQTAPRHESSQAALQPITDTTFADSSPSGPRVARRVSYRPNQTAAEVRTAESSDPIKTVNENNDSDDVAEVSRLDQATAKLLGEGTPEWIKKGLVLGEDHNLAINSSFYADMNECEEDLRARMMSEIREYLDKNVLTRARAASLPELTEDYVQKYWVVPSQRYDNVRESNGETLHQLWMGLHISSEQLKKVRDWEDAGLRQDRTRQIGIVSGLGIAGLTLLSGLVGVFARREKAKLKA